MKGKGMYRVGSGATSLMMLLVILCLTALSVVSYSTAVSEVSVARRSAQVTQQVYDAMAQGYDALAQADAALWQAWQEGSEDDYPARAEACLRPAWEVEDGEARQVIPITENLSLAVTLRLTAGEDSAARYTLIGFQTQPTGQEMEEFP